MMFKLMILIFLLSLNSYATTFNYPTSINVWNSKEQTKIVGDCVIKDTTTSVADKYDANKIKCHFTQISIRKEVSSNRNMTENELLQFYLFSRKVKSAEELKRVLCREFGNNPESYDLTDPFGKNQYDSHVHLCEKNGDISTFIKEGTKNWSDNMLNSNECSLFVHNYSLDFKYSPINSVWVSTSAPQEKYCGRVVVTTLYSDPKVPLIWHYKETHVNTDSNGTFGAILPSTQKNCRKLPNVESQKFYGLQQFDKRNGFTKVDNSLSRSTIYTKCDRFSLNS